MGAGFVNGGVIICEGDDVINDLNRVFGDPKTDAYKYARDNKDLFKTIGKVDGNYTALIQAYETTMQQKASAGWQLYLKRLGSLTTVSPDQGRTNIYDIAQFRYHQLSANRPMKTGVHLPQHGGHVRTTPESVGEDNAITAPCPLPQAK